MRVAVGEPRHRRARALRRLDQADDAGIGALGGPPRGRRGRRPRRHWSQPLSTASPAACLHRQRLAGERRLVEHGHALATVPSTGTTSPWRTSSRSPGRIRSSATSSSRPSRWRMAVRGTRASSAVISRRARALGKALEILAAGIHQRDDGRGEFLARRRAPPSSTAPRRCRARHRRAADWSRSRRASASSTGDGDGGPDRVRPGRSRRPGERRSRPLTRRRRGRRDRDGRSACASDIHCHKVPPRERQRHARDQIDRERPAA